MDNQHQHIKGYRDLSAVEIALMNRIKDKAEEVGQLVDSLDKSKFSSVAESIGAAEPPDQRWVSIARTHLQQGFMALTRAVAKPTSF